MSVQYELTNMNRYDKALSLNALTPCTRKKIQRLMSGEGQGNQHAGKEHEDVSCLYIDPESIFNLIWASLYIILFYVIQLQITLSLAFGPTFFQEELEWSSAYLPAYLALMTFLILDMGLSCSKGFYLKGQGKVVDAPSAILKHYLKGQFIVDLATVVIYSVPLYAQSFGLNFLQLVPAALIWIKKFKYQGEVQSFMQYKAGLRAGFMLFVLFIDALLFGNYGACIFIGMDQILYAQSYFGTNTAYYWLTNNASYSISLIAGPWYYEYVYGQQFSTGTLSTLAPGPFAKNPWEALYAIFVMILFMIYASYLADVLIQIVYTYAERRMLHQHNIRSFDNFMRLKDVTQHIRLRVYNYFELKWQLQEKTQSTQQEQMIRKLPLSLKQELLLEIGFAQHLYLIHSLPKQQQLKKLMSLRIFRTTVDADTTIFEPYRPETVRTRNLFFIKEGMAKFFLPADQKQRDSPEIVLSLTNVERVLGVYEFLTGQRHSFSCRSIDLCLLQSLSWDNFMEITTELCLQEEIHELRYKVLVEKDLSLINKVCIVCLQPHVEAECPKIYFGKVFQNKVQVTQGKVIESERKKKQRKNIKSEKLVRKMQQTNEVFGLLSNIRLEALFLMVSRREDRDLIEVEEVQYFRNYLPGGNIKMQQSRAN